MVIFENCNYVVFLRLDQYFVFNSNFLESFAGMVQILGVTVFVVPLVAVLEHIAIAKAFGMVIAEHCLLIFIYMIYLLNFIHILNCFDLTK